MAGPADGSTGLIAVIWAARAARTWTVLEPAGRELLSVTIGSRQPLPAAEQDLRRLRTGPTRSE